MYNSNCSYLRLNTNKLRLACNLSHTHSKPKLNRLVTVDQSENFSTSEGMLEEGRVVTVRMLLKGLYEKACQQKLWSLVRHVAGILEKRVEDLAKAVVSFAFPSELI